MRWFALVCLACALGCAIDIDLGNGFPDAGQPDSGVEVIPVVCPPPASLLSFRISLGATPVTDPSCWNDGGVPVDHTLPAETFEVLLVQKQTLGIVGMSPQRLGDAPLITVGSAIGGSGTSYEWLSSLITSSDNRGTSARFDFDRIDTLETGGTLRLTARWSCQGSTCRLPSDGRSCTVERRFSASAIEPNAAWTTLTTPVLANTRPYLVVIDVGALTRDSVNCTTSATPATREVTPAARVIEIWQIGWPLVRMPPRTWALPGAPSVEVESDFGPFPQEHVTQTDAGLEARETRTTTAVVNVPCSHESGRGLELTSRYECAGAGCQSLAPPDRGQCSVPVPFFAYGL